LFGLVNSIKIKATMEGKMKDWSKGYQVGTLKVLVVRWFYLKKLHQPLISVKSTPKI